MEKHSEFVNECGVVMSSVIGAANGLPDDKEPEVFMQTKANTAYVFAFSDIWHKRNTDIYPVKDFEEGLYSRKAAGFMMLHEQVTARDALSGILDEKNKSWEDFDLKKPNAYTTDAARDLVERKRICSPEEWVEKFNAMRKKNTPSISGKLVLTEKPDGTFSAEAVAFLESPCCWKMQFKMASREDVKSIEDVREVVREAVAEISPWIGEKPGLEAIMHKEKLQKVENRNFNTPEHQWNDFDFRNGAPDAADVRARKEEEEGPKPK